MGDLIPRCGPGGNSADVMVRPGSMFIQKSAPMSANSFVTAITHNIPYFARAPLEALIGEECYGTLVYDFNITDSECLKYALSKGLGFGIVVGGSIVKVPQVSSCNTHLYPLTHAVAP